MIRQSWLRVFAGIEVAAGLVVTSGIIVEIVYGAELGFILISVGSLLIAGGSGLWAKVYVGGR